MKIIEGETKEQFIARYLNEVLVDGGPAAEELWNELENASKQEWGKQISCRFIEPGLVRYNEVDPDTGKPVEATLLVKKETLDAMAASFVGKPIVNRVHKDVAPEDFSLGKADGIVVGVRYNAEDGWYWADFIPFNEETKKNALSKDYYVSCAYLPTDVDESGGLYHNIPFDGEIKAGVGTHIALVKNPRYEGAYIANSIEGGKTKMWKFLKKFKNDKGEEVINASELAEDATVEIDGVKVPMKELVEARNAAEAKKKEVKELTNVADDAVFEIAGEKVTFGELKALHTAKKNAADDDDDDKKKKEKEKENELRNEAHAAGKHEKPVENCALCKEKKNAEDAEFKRINEKINARNGDKPKEANLSTRHERAAEGQKRYGKIEKK